MTATLCTPMSRRRKSFMRAAIVERYLGSPCPYCGTALLPPAHPDPAAMTRDHFIPRCRGGSDLPSNLVAVCSECNELKGDLLPTEWLEHLRRDGDPRAVRLAAILDGVPRLRRACDAVEADERAQVDANFGSVLL